MLALLIEANRKVAYLDDVLDPENEENANIDVGEVINYIGATDFAIDRLEKLPLCMRLLKETHAVLIKGVRGSDKTPGEFRMIQAALIHYQFETIHPFLDGNGRIGRLLITLFLLQKKIISKPILYISCFLKINRVEYYDRLSEVRRSGNYEQWIFFFLQMILEPSAKRGKASLYSYTDYLAILRRGTEL